MGRCHDHCNFSTSKENTHGSLYFNSECLGGIVLNIVDASNPIPKYLQISAWIKELIVSGRYKNGDKLPSEIKLSKLCDVNRNTLRQAISELIAEGFLRKEKGLGTYVVSPRSIALKHRVKHISSFKDDLNGIGLRENTLIINKELAQAPEHVAEALILGENRNVFTVCRLRIGENMPLIYEESYLPVDLFNGILDMDLTGSMYKMMTKQFGITLSRCDQTIKATNLNERVSAMFGLPKNSAGLYMESITYNENNIPVEVLFSFYRGDKWIFEAQVGEYNIR
jgi:GntR family transcriptional regulator